ncbi:MAG: hypothetical protein K2Q20_06885 [Phycisphaerales bacterium]|nr:hypothetical protein [Phycisphaerales bacterium]
MTTTTASRRSGPSLLLLCGALMLSAPLGGVAFAQIGSALPEEVSRTPAVSAEQKAAIQRLIADNTAGLLSDAAAIRRARNALVAPLRVARISNAFRLEYSSQLLPVIRPLLTSDKPEVSVNAVRLAGELGTRSGMDLLEAALKDKRPEVRVMAAMGFARTFNTAREASTPLIPAQTDPSLAALSAALGAENEPTVLDALFSALQSAAKVPDDSIPGLRIRALEEIGAQAASLAQRAKPEQDAVLLRATKALYDELGVDASRPPSQATIKNAGAAAGESAALILRRLAGELPADHRAELGLLGDQASLLYFVAVKRSGASGAAQPKIGDAVRETGSGGAGDVGREAARLFDALTQAPFSLPADRFKK